MAATGISKWECHFDVASSLFKCNFGALMWPSEEILLDFRKERKILLASFPGLL